MSTYSIGTLLRLWKQNQLTPEQASGHAIQHIAALTERQADLEKRLRHLEQSRTESAPKTQA